MNAQDLTEFMACIERQIDKPYIWAGDDFTGYDCSGLVVEALKTIGILSEQDDMSANDMWQKWKAQQVHIPFRGCLVFRLNVMGEATHVGVCKNDRYFIAAEGGGKPIKTMMIPFEELVSALESLAFTMSEEFVGNLVDRFHSIAGWIHGNKKQLLVLLDRIAIIEEARRCNAFIKVRRIDKKFTNPIFVDPWANL